MHFLREEGMAKLIFKKAKIENRLPQNFYDFKRNNELSWEGRSKNSKNLCIVYGSNGVGKSSISEVLNGTKYSELECLYQISKSKISHVNDSTVKDFFTVIKDQNNRNIINGNASNFFLGENIRFEIELHSKVEDFIKNVLPSSLKEEFKIFGIKSKTHKLVKSPLLNDFDSLRDLIKFSFSRTHVVEKKQLVPIFNFIESKDIETTTIDDKVLKFFVDEFQRKESGNLDTFMELLESSANLKSIHEYSTQKLALNLLNHMQGDKCIVCDTEGIDIKSLKKNKEILISYMEKKLKSNDKLLIEYKNYLESKGDPFGIIDALENYSGEDQLKQIIFVRQNIIIEQKKYIKHIVYRLHEKLLSLEGRLSECVNYFELLEKEIKFSDNDIYLIQKIINQNLHKDFSIRRDSNNHKLVLYIDEVDFLGKSRESLPLSAGEQNFLSLVFEMLRVKNLSTPIIVFDDPISSFDSIYKNKIAFLILLVLQEKSLILLTHNLDLVRLIHCQNRGSYNLYLFQKTGETGFIQVNSAEIGNLLSIVELNKCLGSEILNKRIQEKKLFLIALFPYLRGYANIMGNREIFSHFSSLMHGYRGSEKIAIIDDIRNLSNNINFSFIGDADLNEISSDDIILEVEEYIGSKWTVKGLNKLVIRYPLLDKTLKHSLLYLYLRIKTEKCLIEHFKLKIPTEKHPSLQDIIIISSRKILDKEKQSIFRAELLSKKTLLNEFNHFEGNLNLFQPAIDISDEDLINERKQVLYILNNLKQFKIAE